MKKVSIIVPCYTVEGYINNCLFSLCNQSLKDIEIIAVDDGSKDKTGSILDDYAKKYDNLVVIHKKNGGVSAARNDALKVASGEYIGFLDSDDWVNVKMFEKMYNAAKENDYDLVKIIGIVETQPEYERFLVPNGVSKSAIRYLARCQVRKD